MKRVSLLLSAVLLIGTLFGTQVMAQGHIDLNAAKATEECRNVKMDGFSASFSYSSIESQRVDTEKGVFSIITMGNSVAAGNIGDPQVPVTRKLIAVPFGATPVVTVKNYTVEEYNLADYGIERLYPQQASVSKSDNNPKFAYNEAAYAVKGFDETRPIAEVTVMGTMRGIQIGALQLNTLRYNASSNTIRVYNNVEVEVSFKNADLALTEQTLVNTYSPYFKTVYASLFNEKAITDVYDEHPDLWTVPVKVLVVANRMFEESIQPWITWKTEKGFIMDVNYTDEIGTTAASIKTFIHNKYNQGVTEGNAPSFIIIFGDKNQVPASQTGSASHCVTDLYYYTTDGDVFGDMYHSRFTAETVEEMNVMIGKTLMYEQYTMPDPSYLSNVLLIAGWDDTWTAKDGRPTIQYAMNYYYNTEHGFSNVYNWLGEGGEYSYTGCYVPLSTGVGFANYTAHGSNTSWHEPQLTNSDINNLTNQDKYFWAMGNCCQAADWGISGKCFGEAFVLAPNKGAFAYVGSCPSTYWYEDYYFGVGATTVFYQAPDFDQTSMGCYDSQFLENTFNSLSSVIYVGNLAVAYAHANGYDGSVSDQYYWESYHVLGDGTICPFKTNPVANTVNHLPTLPIGMETYTVSADPGSYVGITKDGVFCGAGEIGEEGTADIPITPITSGGDVKIVVTHPDRQPYIAVVPAAAMDGAYVAIDNFAMNVSQANYGETIDLNITLKNVGTQTANNVTATLSTENEYVEILSAEGHISTLNPDQSMTIQGFQFSVAEDVPDKTKALFFLTATDGENVWEGRITIELHAAGLAFVGIQREEGHSSPQLKLTYRNTGSAPFYGGTVNISSSSQYLTFDEETIELSNTTAGGEDIVFFAPYTLDEENLEPGTTIEISHNMTTGRLATDEELYIFTYETLMEDFESGEFDSNWTQSANYGWTIEEDGRGNHYAKSTNQGIHNSESFCQLTVDVPVAGDMIFTFKVSSERNYDKLHFYMDNNEIANWSGFEGNDFNDWTQYTQPVTTGTHTFKWSYTKDSSLDKGEDTAWLDDIIFPYVHIVTFIAPAEDLEAEVQNADVVLTWTASADAANYIVKRNGEVIATIAETTFTDLSVADGTYEYTVYAANDNGQLSKPVKATATIDYTAADENAESRISVYPNPANNVLNIVTADNFEYRLINSTGQEVAFGAAKGVKQLNVSNLSKGVYFLHLTSGAKTSTEKIVIE